MVSRQILKLQVSYAENNQFQQQKRPPLKCVSFQEEGALSWFSRTRDLSCAVTVWGSSRSNLGGTIQVQVVYLGTKSR